MEDYLPPIVTKLKGDWSDLRNAFLESRAAAKAWAVGIKDDIVSGMRDAGHKGGLAFADALKATAGKELLEGFDEDIGRKLGEQARKMGKRGGQSAAEGLIETFKAMLMPALIATVIMLTPMLGTAIGAAVTTGFGLGFAGLSIFLLRQQPAVLQAATVLKDTLKSVFIDAAMPVLPHLLEAINRLIVFTREFGPSFKEIFTAIGPAIPILASGLAMLIREALPGLKEAAPLMADLLAALGFMGADIGRGLTDFLREMVAVGPQLTQFMLDFGDFLGDVISLTGVVIAALARIHGFVEHGKGQGFGLFGGIEMLKGAWPHVVAGAKAAWEWIKKVADAVGTWVSDKASAVAAWWNGVVDTVGTKGKAVLDWFEALPGRIGDFVASIPGRIRDAAVRMFDGFFFGIGFATVRVLQFIGFLYTLPQRLALIGVQMWESLKLKTVQGAEETARVVHTWAERIPVILDGLWHQLVAWGKKTWEATTTWAAKTITDVFNWWAQLPGKIGGVVGSVMKTIKDWAGGAIKWLYEAGKDMVRGLIDGAIAATDGAIAAIKRAIQRIIDGAKSALGIASPSTVFAELGRFSMLGFMQGMQGERGALARAWAGLAPSAPTVAAAGAPALAYAAGGDGPPILVQLYLDGDKLEERLIERAQRRKGRTGTTGYT